MADKKDEPLDHASEQENLEFDAVAMAFHDHVEAFAEEHDLHEEVVSLLALKESLVTRMIGYVISVEQPSASGLRLDLDRFRRDFDEIVRIARKDAEEFVANAKEAFAADQSPDET